MADSAYLAAAKNHAATAEQLLDNVALGTSRFGAFAPAAVTTAAAAQAHATLALVFAQIASRDEEEVQVA